MLIHQIYLTKDIPKHLKIWMRGWENSGNDYRLWQYKDVEHWVDELKVVGLDKLSPALQSDLLRLFIMRDHGGMYVDSDCELVKSIPTNLPESFVGYWYAGADPFFIHAKPNDKNVLFMINHGYKQPIDAYAVTRWGFKAFNTWWPGIVLDIQSWCKHHSQHSWGTSHQTIPRRIPEYRPLTV